MKKIVVSTLFLVLSSIAPQAAAQGMNTSEVDALVKQNMERFAVPGLGLALVKDGKVVYTQGYGVRDVKSKTPVNADTLFAIGSVTKSFTSLAMMQQVAARKLDLDAPVQKYLPDLKFSDAAMGSKVTVRQLLSMTSGLDRFDNWAFDPKVNSRSKMLETIAEIPFSAAPGKVFQYNNQNYVAAAAILEKLTNQSWEAYTKANIFAPLGMNRAQFDFPDAVKDGNYAAGHQVGIGGVQGLASFERFPVIAPAGSIHASVSDMAKYVGFQMSRGSRVASFFALKEMHSPQIAIGDAYSSSIAGVAGFGYGMGWFTQEYRGYKVVEHGGNINGFTANVQMLPQKGWGLVLLANRDGANAFMDATRFAITESLLNIRPRNDFSNAPSIADQEILMAAKSFVAKPEVLKQLEGTYALITNDQLQVALENGKLIAIQGGQRFPLIAASDTHYVADLGVALIVLEFQPAANGMVWLYQGGQIVGVKVPSTATAAAAPKTLTDSQNRFSATLPSGLEVVQTTPQFIVTQSDKPASVFLFNVSAAKATLEETALGFIKILDPNFNLKPAQTSSLPAINGVVWTQILYSLPQDQTLAVFATQKGSSVYMVVVQADTKDLQALTAWIGQILSSYKIL